MLTQTMLFSLSITVVAFELSRRVFERFGKNPLFHPLTWTVLLVIGTLKLIKLDYSTYFDGAKPLHFLLGPATVALALPLYEERQRIYHSFIPLMTSLLVGSITGVLSSAGLAALLGGSKLIVLSLAPKSVTTPIAMQIAAGNGGEPALTAGLVVVTGIFGAATIPTVFRLFHRKTIKSSGFAIGMAAHGIGTARAFESSNEMGAFSGLAIGLNGLVTAIVVPIFARLLHLSQ